MHRDEIPPGTLYMLILRTLSRAGKMHGYEIASFIKKISDDVLQVEEGSLYPALQRMLVKGWVTAQWGTTDGNRRARYYKLTTAGRKRLEAEISQFGRVVAAIGRVIQTAYRGEIRWPKLQGGLAISSGGWECCCGGKNSTAKWTRRCACTAS